MEEKVRLYIRKFLLENFYQEATTSDHYEERVGGRIKNAVPKTSSYAEGDKIPSIVMAKVFELIEVIKKIDFAPNESYAIKLINLPTTYKHLDLDRQGKTQIDRNTGKVKESVGDTIWIIIRENDIKTIFLRNSFQKDNVPDIQYYVKTPLNLKSFYDEIPKKENGHVNFKMSAFDVFMKNKNSKEKAYPKVDLTTGTWFIDDKSKTLFQKAKKGNKITNKISDYENNLSDEDLEKVWDTLEGELVMEFYFK